MRWPVPTVIKNMPESWHLNLYGTKTLMMFFLMLQFIMTLIMLLQHEICGKLCFTRLGVRYVVYKFEINTVAGTISDIYTEFSREVGNLHNYLKIMSLRFSQ